ncbi:hypothetical protein DEH79_01405 [Mycoplasmopsis synoviae]|nr:hypothetical protein MSH_01405 [Mycoplasmopsis synoviae]QLE13796.1 hypothetical protein DEH79_01405 [Mycoplasmopsis synoviae]
MVTCTLQYGKLFPNSSFFFLFLNKKAILKIKNPNYFFDLINYLKNCFLISITILNIKKNILNIFNI